MGDSNETKKIENFSDLFELVDKLIVPPYQRAYAWESEQIDDFVSDMLEMKNNGKYYFGHFILEKTTFGYEIIDGQQRITTFILFLMVCSLFESNDYEKYIQKFETVEYDREVFTCIKSNLKLQEKEWELKDFGFNAEVTLSAKRILFALNHFRKFFFENKSELKLNTEHIVDYIETFKQAQVSAHIAIGKAISVQIFELQNTRGIKLNLIEKVKSKLMKAAYINADIGAKENVISILQENFAEIYRLEESASLKSFSGNLSLEDILLHHLRIVDDGSKLNATDKSIFNSPPKYGEKEKSILTYLDDMISTLADINAVKYIINLTEKFKKSVEFVSDLLPKMDKENHLIGDVFILDRILSLEFFILIYHKGLETVLNNIDIVLLWEKFLFTRDFHDKYYRIWYRDDFERMFHEMVNINEPSKIEFILNKYLNEGFRNELMVNKSLPETVRSYIQENVGNILNNAFYWWHEKMVYLLYKYEIRFYSDFFRLREIMKVGKSIEHILPQEWDWEWIAKGNTLDTLVKQEIIKEINSYKNGVGNLLIITGSENSSLKNIHPMVKIYNNYQGGSYAKHNSTRDKWENYLEWKIIISERGQELYKFLFDFVK